MKKELTEEQRIENRKFLNRYVGIATGVITAYLFGYIGSYTYHSTMGILNAFTKSMEKIAEFHLFYPINSNALMGMLLGGLIGFFVYMSNQIHDEKTSAYKSDEVAGSARFMTKKEMAEYVKEFIETDPTDLSLPFTSMILSNNFYRPINSRKLIGNNNVLVVGGAGSGKSRFVIKPNVLQMNASYVITDPSGEMIYSLGDSLKKNGYKIKIFNISDMQHSNCYNPLHYIRDEAGVNMLIDCFIKNTTKDGAKGDEFFTNAERILYSACIFYLTEHCQDESRKNFGSIINMINSSAVDENNPNAKSPLDKLFDGLPKDSLAWKSYKSFKQAAGKTLKSIIISCVTRLQPFLTPQVANLTKYDNLELEKIGDEKTALFIITPQADRTYAFLASMLYSQLFETLYNKGENQKKAGGSEQMHIPVRCLMDEFANIGEVPEFPSKLSTMRKYNISATVILQDISQIEAMYKDEWKTLVGNCSSIVFLGSQEPNTLKYFSEMLGKTTVKNKGRGNSMGKQKSASQNITNTARDLRSADELGRMAPDMCIVFTQNKRPVLDQKYNYERHPRYHLTADYNNEFGFKYADMPIYDNNRFNIGNLLKAKSEAARIAKEDIVTTSKSTKDAYVKESLAKAMDQFQLDESVEQMSYLQRLTACQLQLKDSMHLPVSFITLSSISLSRLLNVATQLKTEEKPYFIFSTFEKDEKAICVAYDESGELYPDIQMQFITKYKLQNGFCIIEFSKYRIEEFKKAILRKMDGNMFKKYEPAAKRTVKNPNVTEKPYSEENMQKKKTEQPALEDALLR